ncbi:aromatic prenyltransferase [Streptomyces sp. CMB-StM0423]|uniref:aromatic prenyltransferase n=1 Tax=Streptomyces sp. CMB-StM0423 TaxID=2059884 RepID=UPI00131BA75C|nr:aromatic prenyltransferase [Streptomyces sp. CMB-StM0423]
MSGANDVERVYSAMEEAAGLLGVPVAREKVRPVLTAYQEALADAVVVFSMAGGRRATELDFSISVPTDHGDPFTTALQRGLTEKTGHPVDNLLAELREGFPLGMYAIDGMVSTGFKKTYASFPTNEPQPLADLLDVPSMPASARANAKLFADYGLDKVQMVSVDYPKRQVNLYFSELNTDYLQPAQVKALAAEMGLVEPTGMGLEFAKGSFAVYPTLSYDTDASDRLCYAVISSDPTLAPTTSEPEVTQFSMYANNAPYAYAGENRTLVYGLTLTPKEEYYKLGSYYQITDYQRKLVKAFEALD